MTLKLETLVEAIVADNELASKSLVDLVVWSDEQIAAIRVVVARRLERETSSYAEAMNSRRALTEAEDAGLNAINSAIENAVRWKS